MDSTASATPEALGEFDGPEHERLGIDARDIQSLVAFAKDELTGFGRSFHANAVALDGSDGLPEARGDGWIDVDFCHNPIVEEPLGCVLSRWHRGEWGVVNRSLDSYCSAVSIVFAHPCETLAYAFARAYADLANESCPPSAACPCPCPYYVAPARLSWGVQNQGPSFTGNYDDEPKIWMVDALGTEAMTEEWLAAREREWLAAGLPETPATTAPPRAKRV